LTRGSKHIHGSGGRILSRHCQHRRRPPTHVLPAQPNNAASRGACHTSNTFSSDTSHQAINPVGMLLRLTHNDGVALLQNLVDRDERLECLNLVGEDRLSGTRKRICQPCTTACRPYHFLHPQPGTHTLSCPPKRLPTTCGPMCTQCNSAHAFLQPSKGISRLEL
jgi:hypothetical protein